jgi:HD domain-containing protein/GAF domain-containing protein
MRDTSVTVGAESARRLTDDVVRLREVAHEPTVDRALAAVRDFLGMDMAFVGEFSDDRQVYRATSGDGASFGVHEGAALPLEETYCRRIIAGRLPNVIGDVGADQRAASLSITAAADVGAFASVPIVFSDGRLYGTLCAASHRAVPSLGYRDVQFLHVFARLVADQLEREELQDAAREAEVRAAAAETLVAAVEARDHYTGEHSRAVVAHAVGVARHLGLDEKGVTEVRQVALLHDIGKLAIPDAILHKSGPLTEDEWQVMRQHPVFSERLIRNVPRLAHLAPAVRAEHERWDGAGYPDGLAGEEIPLASRITFVCDAYHAMTSDRPYRRALPPERARAELTAGIASQFCPRAARALLSLLRAA